MALIKLIIKNIISSIVIGLKKFQFFTKSVGKLLLDKMLTDSTISYNL